MRACTCGWVSARVVRTCECGLQARGGPSECPRHVRVCARCARASQRGGGRGPGRKGLSGGGFGSAGLRLPRPLPPFDPAIPGGGAHSSQTVDAGERWGGAGQGTPGLGVSGGRPGPEVSCGGHAGSGYAPAGGPRTRGRRGPGKGSLLRFPGLWPLAPRITTPGGGVCLPMNLCVHLRCARVSTPARDAPRSAGPSAGRGGCGTSGNRAVPSGRGAPSRSSVLGRRGRAGGLPGKAWGDRRSSTGAECALAEGAVKHRPGGRELGALVRRGGASDTPRDCGVLSGASGSPSWSPHSLEAAAPGLQRWR